MISTSVIEVVVHGIPRKDVDRADGDVLAIDFGAFKDGWCGDSARTIPIGKVKADALKLIEATRESLDQGIAQCIPGKRIGDIGFAVQSWVEPRGYAVVTQFVGHGIGRAMHEWPDVPNFGRAGRGPKLAPGVALAIEPMVVAGPADVYTADDGWSVITEDGAWAAHTEHTVAVTDNGPEILTRP